MAERGSREKLKVVLDASVVAKWILSGEPWEEEARLVKDAVAEGRVEAHVPALLLYELSSVASRCVRSGLLSVEQAGEALTLLEYLLVVHPVRWQDLPDMIKLSGATGLTVYDSAYILLAARIGATLVTADEELIKRGGSFAEVAHVADLALRLRLQAS